MKYEDFTQKYATWTRHPRTAGEAFKTAEYATAVEVYNPTVRWRAMLGEALLTVVAAITVAVILYAVGRGVL